jgi:hypothetical protein
MEEEMTRNEPGSTTSTFQRWGEDSEDFIRERREFWTV